LGEGFQKSANRDRPQYAQFPTARASTEIGYDIRSDNAVLIARKAVEVNFGSGYRKRYWGTVSFFE